MKAFLKKYRYQLVLVLLILLAMYPLTFFIKIPKWDNASAFLPYRYFISDYVWNGSMPFWNPFQTLGLPAYSDLQSGAWNPVVWFILLFGKYTVNSLIAELLIYYVIAGLGMFQLGKYLFKCEKTAFILGLSYALSGYMIGTSQIMVFIIAAAWFPWVIHAILKFFDTHELKHQLLSALFLGLFVSGASPSYTIVLAYIIAGMFIYQFLTKREHFKKLSLGAPVIIGTSVILLLPYLNSFVEFAPYFNRGERLAYSEYLLDNPFTPVSYISFILPQSILAIDPVYDITNITLRNAYFGLIGFIGFAMAIFPKYTRLKVIMLSCFVLSLIVSAGDGTFIYQFLYKLPGWGVFRHPSMFRLFAIFCGLILAGIEIKELFEGGIQKKHKIAFILALTGLLIVSILHGSALSEAGSLVNEIITNVEFSSKHLYVHIILNALISLIILLLFLISWKIKKYSIFIGIALIVFLDLGIQARISAPTTVYYNFPAKSASKFFCDLPNDIDQNYNYTPLSALNENQPNMGADGIWDNLSTYQKRISYVGLNPLAFKNFEKAKENGSLLEAIEHNIIYIDADSSTPSNIQVLYNGFSAEVENSTSKTKTVVLNQNYHHLWKAELNGKEKEVYLHNNLSMSIELDPGEYGKLEFSFNSPKTLPFFVISLVGYLSLLSWLFIQKKQARA